MSTEREYVDLSAAERVLVFLRDRGAFSDRAGFCTPKIAEACRLRPTSTSTLLGELVARGVIHREYNPAGRRTYMVALTEKGKTVAAKIEAPYVELELAAAPASNGTAGASPKSRHLIPAPPRGESPVSSSTRPPATPPTPEMIAVADRRVARQRGDDPAELVVLPDLEPELRAIASCVAVLRALDDAEARPRVVGYLVARFGTNVEMGAQE